MIKLKDLLQESDIQNLETVNEMSVNDLIKKGKKFFGISSTKSDIDSKTYDKLNTIADEFNGSISAMAKDGDTIKFAIDRRDGTSGKYQYDTKSGDVSTL